MDPFTLGFTTAYIANITATLTANIMTACSRRVRGLLQAPGGEKALERCVQAGIVAVLAHARVESAEEEQLLEEIFTRFFSDTDAAREISSILFGRSMNLDEIESIFGDSGFDASTLPGIDLKLAISAFEAAFLTAAVQEPEIQPVIDTVQALAQTRIQQEMLTVMQELVRFLKNSNPETIQIKGGVVIAEDPGTGMPLSHSLIPTTSRFEDTGEQFYLKRLVANCQYVDTAVLDESCFADDLSAPTIRIADVFTTLYLKGIDRLVDESVSDALLQPRSHREEPIKSEIVERVPIQATEAISAMDRLVILGRPGGGKSTLVNHMTTQLGLNRLSGADESVALPGWNATGALLPVRIILRDLAAWMNIPARGTEGLVWDYLANLLKDWGCEDQMNALKRALDQAGGIVFFDGLDEVPEEDEEQKRKIIIEAIKAFAAPLDKCKVIVTSREYAYNADARWRLPEALFPVVELDLFHTEQIEAFTQSWYHVTGEWKGWRADRRSTEGKNLSDAIAALPHLAELGQYPLLLTLMAQVHGRDGYLPENRADLYERAVNLLLAHWENRIVRELDGSCRVEPGLVMKLKVPLDTLRIALEHVALNAHTRQGQQGGDRSSCADISREELRLELAEGLGGSLDKAEAVIAYIQNRTGLLLARDNHTFAFPHRTFQEYLAATAIMRRGDFEEFLRSKILQDAPWWQEVFLLAAGSSRQTPRNIYMLVDALLPEAPDETAVTSEISGLARLAARTMGETQFVKHVEREGKSTPGRYATIHRRVQYWLLGAMTADTVLAAGERSDCGTALNWVGDPRFDAGNWYLPVGEDEGFVRIPTGPFLMGSDEGKDKDAYDDELPQHEIGLSEYYISRYPVTVDQFRVFLMDSRYAMDSRDWKKYNVHGNHPVVTVSWDDASAYAAWLTDKLEHKGWRVQLPSEAQWEKAARGSDGRIFPWGDTFDANKANMDQSGINSTSAVGCFPGGNSFYDICDMAGNVYEWCMDWYDEKYYKKSKKIDPHRAEDGSHRILRGGSWDNPARLCRAASRFWNRPGARFPFFGFRLVLLAGQQTG